MPRLSHHLRLFAVLGTLGTCVWPSPAHAAPNQRQDTVHRAAKIKVKPKPSPVLTVITAEAKAGQLPMAQANTEIASWNAATAAAASEMHKSVTRADEILDVQAVDAKFAASKQLTAARVEPVMSSLRATVYEMTKVSAYPYYGEEIQVPGDPAVYEFYPGEGVQFDPKDSFTAAANDATSKNTTALLPLLARLQQFEVHRAGFVAWEFYFNWEGAGPGWISALSQGSAMGALAQATVATGDPQWAALAQQVEPSFAIPDTQGGVMEPQSNGAWYMNYPFHPGERILNVQLYALLGLHTYAAANPADTEATTLFNSGLAATEAMLPQFDTGAWSLYELGTESPLNYQEDVETTLGKLFTITKYQPFKTEQQNFELYEAAPPTITPSQTPLTLAFPAPVKAKAGSRTKAKAKKPPTVGIGFTLDKISSVTVTISKQGSAASVDSIRLGTIAHGTHVVTWSGTTAAGKLVATGIYQATITARDLAGNASDPATSGPVTVTTAGAAPPASATTPATAPTPGTPAASG